MNDGQALHRLLSSALRGGVLIGTLCLACGPASAVDDTPVAAPTSLPLPGAPAFVVKKASPALLKSLKKGGYVLYLRHGNTDSQQPDQANLDLDDCSTQRPLNAEGRKVARDVGAAIRRAGIPVGDVFTSPLCRTRETATLAFGNRAQVDPLLMYTSHLTAVQKRPIVDNTRRLLSSAVPAGTNRVLVAHGPNLADLMGYFVKPEGTLVVFRPLGQGRYDYLASVPPSAWPGLLRK